LRDRQPDTKGQLRYIPPQEKGIAMTLQIPQGFQMAAVHCGVKQAAAQEDLTLIVCRDGAVAAGVYTTNLICAAPVRLDRGRTPGRDIRAVVVNSGNANACTGVQGEADACRMAQLAAAACGADEQQALVMSTGIIGQRLEMDKIAAGITAAAARLGDDPASLEAASRGILTTDKAPKVASCRVELGGGQVHITGLAKGAGMIGPKMATLLGVLMTDAALEPEDAQSVLREAVRVSFNCISVEGHTSTNDTVLLLASGKSVEAPLTGDELRTFAAALTDVCTALARSIPADGEGATHLIVIDVAGCDSDDDAFRIAKTIADSPLVKTAVAGCDPNWGRIVSAAGYAGVPFDPGRLDLSLNGVLLYNQGTPVEFDAAAVSAGMREFETHVAVSVGTGSGKCRFFTSDLTAEYIHINADYHT
jgi:glutamate N-acetyltransferase/amino-acid N-acetyltransferase